MRVYDPYCIEQDDDGVAPLPSLSRRLADNPTATEWVSMLRLSTIGSAEVFAADGLIADYTVASKVLKIDDNHENHNNKHDTAHDDPFSPFNGASARPNGWSLGLSHPPKEHHHTLLPPPLIASLDR